MVDKRFEDVDYEEVIFQTSSGIQRLYLHKIFDKKIIEKFGKW